MSRASQLAAIEQAQHALALARTVALAGRDASLYVTLARRALSSVRAPRRDLPTFHGGGDQVRK